MCWFTECVGRSYKLYIDFLIQHGVVIVYSSKLCNKIWLHSLPRTELASLSFQVTILTVLQKQLGREGMSTVTQPGIYTPPAYYPHWVLLHNQSIGRKGQLGLRTSEIVFAESVCKSLFVPKTRLTHFNARVIIVLEKGQKELSSA